MRRTTVISSLRRLRAKMWSKRGQPVLSLRLVLMLIICFLAGGLTIAEQRNIEYDRDIGILCGLSEPEDRLTELLDDITGFRSMELLRTPDGICDIIGEVKEPETKETETKAAETRKDDIESDEDLTWKLCTERTLSYMLKLYADTDRVSFTKNELLYAEDRLKQQELYQYVKNILLSLSADVEHFPVLAASVSHEEGLVYANGELPELTYENSWGAKRSYGGDRLHEGTDIMAVNNRAGVYNIVSASDGVIEKLGWLPAGGYRIGIRSSSGLYLYYAHLHSYAEGLYEGMKVYAGDVLGLMGDTGYSEIEGTTGMFDCHLHFGIYIPCNGADISINPYHILCLLEEKSRQ